MRRKIALLGGGLTVAGGALYRVIRRRSGAESDADPAGELRRKLDESRAIAGEREEFESAETPVDQAEPAVDDRRRSVHEQARATIDEMRPPEAD